MSDALPVAVAQPTGITSNKIYSALTFPGQLFFTFVSPNIFNEVEIPIYVISAATWLLLAKLIFGGKR